jgi:uncharacterized protein YukE
MSRFWVNPDGLQDGANGFNDISNSVNMVNGDFQSDANGLYNSLGNGQDVNSFKENFTPSMDQFTSGMDSLAKALLQTADGVKNMAFLFTNTEQNNINMLNSFVAQPPPTSSNSNPNSNNNNNNNNNNDSNNNNNDNNNNSNDYSQLQPRLDDMTPTTPAIPETPAVPPSGSNDLATPPGSPNVVPGEPETVPLQPRLDSMTPTTDAVPPTQTDLNQSGLPNVVPGQPETVPLQPRLDSMTPTTPAIPETPAVPPSGSPPQVTSWVSPSQLTVPGQPLSQGPEMIPQSGTPLTPRTDAVPPS